MIKTEAINLSSVEMLVLDEADRLFSMGFVEQVDEILAACNNPKVVRALFSATMLPLIEAMAKSFLKDPIRITIGNRNAATDTIKQKLMFVGRDQGKILAIRQIIKAGIRPPVLIFVESVDRARELFQELIYDSINVDVIHAERTQTQRENIIKSFRSGKIWMLICTDLMARGIDFKGVSCVINYDFPQTPISYIHRIGRTGRAGRQGEAITLFTEDDAEHLRAIVNVMKASGCDVPDWMLNVRKQPAPVNQRRPVQSSDEAGPRKAPQAPPQKHKKRKRPNSE
eukprot:TRINITY_DN4417_c0_g1_i10.p1 TRINITY_DN4417_c0_g1~~TRINITY_DN4417_c0_g1_i10.p1  ORF type:complete len:284 (+),score=61.09 TRINITY_DN4417_c0_g1_i10:244-1095(+)